MGNTKEALKYKFSCIPSINKILNNPLLKGFCQELNYDLLKKIIQECLADIREEIKSGISYDGESQVIEVLNKKIYEILQPPLKPLINATGVVLNTNLGRAPLGKELLNRINTVVEGYNNIEFDLERGTRGSRNKHLITILHFLLGYEDSLVVNNNAAALYLVLKSLADGQEVIVSRGELVEIGGSFRIPEIIANSGAIMVEVGTTNKTRLKDYEDVITEKTKAILKVHKSNYYINGFTQDVSAQEISKLAKEYDILSIFDFGTGLPDIRLVDNSIKEPDIKTIADYGMDIVTFSCDKLLGGPQAGIIAGRKDLIDQVHKHPLMRILRVDKIIITALFYSLRILFYNDKIIREKVPLFKYLNRDKEQLQLMAEKLSVSIKYDILNAEVIDNDAYCGGGTLPNYKIKSKAVMLTPLFKEGRHGKQFVDIFYDKLLKADVPIVPIIREGKIIFDVLTLEFEHIDMIADTVKKIVCHM